MFENFPYTNFHDLNLDWLIEKIMTAYSPDNPPPLGLVLSVNGETGAVVLYRDPIVRLPDIPDTGWNIHRLTDGTSTGIQFIKGQPAQRIDGVNRYNIYDEGNPPPTYISVVSVNGQTGAVVLTGEDLLTVDVPGSNTIAQDIAYLKSRTVPHAAIHKINGDGVLSYSDILSQFKTDLDNLTREDGLFTVLTIGDDVYNITSFNDNTNVYVFTNQNMNYGSNVTITKQVIINPGGADYLQINSDGSRSSYSSSIVPSNIQLGIWL